MFGINYIKKILANNAQIWEIMEFVENNNVEKIKELSPESLNKFIYEKPNTLHNLAENNKLEMMKFFIKLFDVNLKDDKKNTALINASRMGHLEIVKMLIKKGAEINLQNETGWTALISAAKGGFTDTVKILIDSGADVNIQNNDGLPALFYSVFDGHAGIVKMLVNSGAYVIIQNKYGNSILRATAESGNLEIVKILLDSGMDVNIQDNNGITDLMIMSYTGNTKIVELLISAGANVNIQDIEGGTALKAAIEEGYHDIVKLLILAGANTKLTYNSITAKELALDKGHHEIVEIFEELEEEEEIRFHQLIIQIEDSNIDDVKELIEKNNELIKIKDKYGKTILHYAVEYAEKELVEFLLELKADINNTSNEGFTALTSLCFLEKLDTEYISIIKSLIKNENINLDIKDSQGNSALHWSLKNKHLDIAKLLIKSGADINLNESDISSEMTYNNKNTPLHIAINKGLTDIVKVLIENGVKLDEYNGSEQTPLYTACSKNNIEIVKLLVEAGANIHEVCGGNWDEKEVCLEKVIKEGYDELVDYLIENGGMQNKHNLEKHILNALNSNNHKLLDKLITMSVQDDERAILELLYDKVYRKIYDYAIEKDSAEHIDILIKHDYGTVSIRTAPKSSIKIEFDCEAESENTLYESICKNNLKNILNLLIRKKVDINSKDLKNRTLISYATQYNKFIIVKLLVEAGANLDLQEEDGKTALMIASGRNYLKVLKLLLEAGANLDLQNKDGKTALMIASGRECLEVLKLLVEAGANLDLQNKDGKTALLKTSISSNVEPTKLLVEAGANLDLQDKDGVTILMLASLAGNIEKVKLLVEAGANLDLQHKNGATTLMGVSKKGKVEIVKLLVDAGANLDLQEKGGSTALMLASNNGHIEIIKQLVEAGAKYSDSLYYKSFQKNRLEVFIYLLTHFTRSEIKSTFKESIQEFTFKNISFKLSTASVSDNCIKLGYENTDHEIVADFGSYFDKIIGIENFRYYYKKDKLTLEFMKPSNFNKLLKDFKIQNEYLELYAIKEINHSKYLFFIENKEITYNTCKENKNEIEQYIGSSVDIEKYDEVHELYDPEFSKTKLIIIKENIINVLPKLLNLSGRYLKTEFLNGYTKYYFKDADYDLWNKNLNNICDFLNQRLSIESQSKLLVLTEKIEEVIPRLLDLKDSHKNTPKLELVKEEAGVTKYFYTFLPELDLKEWKLKSRKTNFRVLFNEPNKVYQLDVYNKTSKDYDENLSKNQYIVLKEYSAIPTKEELTDNKLSETTLENNKVFIGFGKGSTQYYVDINKMTHLAVVGSTGSGKSNLMNGIITSLLYNLNHIDKLFLIDLKGTEFVKYEDVKSDKIKLFTKKAKPSMILEALLELEAEIHLRTAYCQKLRLAKLTTNPIFLIIDEFKQIDNIYCETSKDHKDLDEIYKSLSRIGSLSRSSNVKIIVQTQGARDIPEDIRKHCMSRILMKTAVENDRDIQLQNSDKVLELGINHLNFDKGRFIFEDDNDGDTCTSELQFPFVDPYDNLHLSFQMDYDNKETQNFNLKLDEYIPSVKEEYKQLSNTKRLKLKDEEHIVENKNEIIKEIQNKEKNSFTSSIKKASFNFDAFEEEIVEEEKDFKQVEEIQSKIQKFKKDLASKYE